MVILFVDNLCLSTYRRLETDVAFAILFVGNQIDEGFMLRWNDFNRFTVP